ncbi:isopenicillin N synthase family dioxygenase [Sphingomicrobium astaxanthinifaciens]|uniref:isopenicillin N synthase family dioxygenase n=1 Tax=Sphingomicrobium astaxanthinifaciens TaxID=1227949 RepID=UPI001FCC697C|nr:2-oxoglutarate and iron-dependent oxygenase domain-containing protein [Sphingomicrobium astaxanthinifaciens]MCJ7420478.1 isopenicillin N synthase family oxygenase [Sphingomicrobium astaxanthinifaciens]
MTKTITSESVATVSLKDDPDTLARDLGNSFVEYGFAIVRDHGIPQDLIDEAHAKAAAFFALPEDVKRKYYIEGGGGARGYTPFGIETAKGAKAYDLKEFYHVGRDLPPGHKFRDHMGDNIWPEEIESFETTFKKLYAEFDHAGERLLRAVARFLDIEEEFLVDAIRDGNSVMRMLHYPPIPAQPGEHIRAGAHGDINAITLLLGAEEAGLQLLTKEGEWLDVKPKEGELAINIGDMLDRLTNGYLPSTQHRVINPTPERASNSRYSMPFFLHFRSDFCIEALPNCVPEGEEPKYPPITADDYLQQRLAEIKLK